MVTDPDGAADITSAIVVLADARGRQLKRWSLADFAAGDANSLTFVRSYRVSGQAPWTVTLTVTDNASQTVTAAAVIQKQ